MKKLRDPLLFEGITKLCQPVPSDDVELQNCPFVHEYNNSPISSPSSASQPTGIIMISVSSTDSDTHSSPHEEFETPPEHNNSSQTYFWASDDPKVIAAVDAQHKRDTDNTVNHDTNSVAVDLANDSDDLGFSDKGDFEEQIQKKMRVAEDDLDVQSSALKIDEKEQGVIEIDQTQEVDTEVVMECEENLEADEQNIKRNSHADSSILKMSKRSDDKGDGGEGHKHGDNEKLKGAIGDDGGRGVGSMENENEKLKGVIGDDGGRGALSMNLDENEKSNGIGVKEMHSNGIRGGGGASGSFERRRELPASMRGEDKNVGLMEAAQRKAAKTGKLKDLMEVVSIVTGGVNGDDINDDFFETAIRRGVTFPRPRWWPPEGVD